MQKDIIILTESDKNHAFCVAGIDIHTGRWVRLVTEDEDTDGALTLEDLTYENGERCKVLDCVRVPIIERCGDQIQPENHLLDRNYYMEKIGKYRLGDVLKVHRPEVHEYILGKNEGHYVTEKYVYNAGGISLVLVEVRNLRIYNNKDSKKKADFYYNSRYYKNFSVTDREYYNREGIINKAILVISLTGKVLHEKYFKCVAKIFEY